MTVTEIAAIIAGAVVIAIVVVWYLLKQNRTKKLRAQFGPEYDLAVRRFGDRTKAEQDLVGRQKRMEKIAIRPLPDAIRDQFAAAWHRIQSAFVDDPPGSIREADRLVCDLMQARGYPVEDFEHRAAVLSVDHPLVIRNYRAAHAVAVRLNNGEIDTEDLRQGLVYYRDLFDELLEVHAVGTREVTR
jgi:hypothetical protein